MRRLAATSLSHFASSARWLMRAWNPPDCFRSCAAILALAAAVAFLWRTGERPATWRLEPVIALIKSGALRPDAGGDITLPPALASDTTNGHVYVLRGRDEQLIVFFPRLWKTVEVDAPWGKKFLVAGYVYSDKRLRRGQGIDLWTFHIETGAIGAAPTQSHWYWVEPFDDD